MAAVPSTMLPLGTKAPDFRLRDTEGREVSLADLNGRPFVIAFISNHCPYVRHILTGLAAFGRDYQGGPLAILAVNPTDPSLHPEDNFEKMRDLARDAGFVFPYLADPEQKMAYDYRAACTPDFFLFDKRHLLSYRGQFDASRPDNEEPVTGFDLRAAVEAVIKGRIYDGAQHPSYGCNIDWRGGEPEWHRVRTEAEAAGPRAESEQESRPLPPTTDIPPQDLEAA